MINLLKIMTFNISAETLCLNNNSKNIIDIIKNINPDILGIQETKCHDEIKNIYTDIKLYDLISKELDFSYEFNDKTHTVIFTKYPIIYSTEKYKGIIIKIQNNNIGIFNIHLTDEPYQPFQILNITYGDYPFINSEQEAINQAKLARREEIQKILNEINEIDKKYNLNAIIVLGDFNEPSHRDWTDKAVMAGIHPLSVEFPSVKYFEDNGFIDTYRHLYPDNIKFPGSTWPTNSKDKNDRIDYILVKSNIFEITEANIIGEKNFALWPSDHRACVCAIDNSKYKYKKFKNKYLKLKNKKFYSIE